MELFEAFGEIEPGSGSYDFVKVWEVELMLKLGETEEVYCSRGKAQRARMIAAMKIPTMIQALDGHRQLEKMRAKRGKS